MDSPGRGWLEGCPLMEEHDQGSLHGLGRDNGVTAWGTAGLLLSVVTADSGIR